MSAIDIKFETAIKKEFCEEYDYLEVKMEKQIEEIYVKEEPTSNFEDENYQNESISDLKSVQGMKEETTKIGEHAKKYKVKKKYRKKGSIKIHQCRFCPESFKFYKEFRTHRKQHQRPFQCEFCEKDFISNSKMEIHKNIHLGLKPFQCNQCEKKYTQRGHLSDHLKTHSGVRPFICVICQKTFSKNSILKKHVNIHLDVKLFQCHVCDKGYNRKDHMKLHMKIHEKICCPICFKTFSNDVKYTMHMTTHSVK